MMDIQEAEIVPSSSLIKKQLRKQYIDKIDDLIQAIEICEEYGIPDEGLDTLDDFIERIKLHYYAQKNGNYMRKIEDAMLRTSEEDVKKRSRLTQMFRDLVQIIGAGNESTRQQFLEDYLSKYGTTENVFDDCEDKIHDLSVKETVIMVAGETSAGKSSFLNLLFGEEILPHSTLSCTSTITTIRYGETKLAKIIFSDPGVEDVVLSIDGEEGLEKFHEFTFQKQREREHGIREVQVSLPLNFLKCGLVLADTPGVGENEYLEEYLMDYIAENDILGFIYLIFTDAGGGVKEDRLLNLLKLVISEQKKEKKAFPFDPKATLFVANRFDAVPDDSKEVVKKHVLEKLNACWPEFDDSLVVFFSTKKAKRDVEANPAYISENYKELLRAFSNMYYYVMDRRLRISYKWIEKVLQRIRHCMKTAVTRLAFTERDNQKRTETHKRRLEKLQKNAALVIKALRQEINNRSKELFDEVKVHLQSPLVAMRCCKVWSQDEIPAINSEITDAKHWLFVKERVDEAFNDRICNEIDQWTEENEKIISIEESIINDIEAKLGIIEDEILQTENAMKYRESEHNGTKSARRMSLRKSLVEIPIKLPVKVHYRVSRFGRGKSDTKKFTKDPEKWVKERSEKLLKKLVENKKVDRTSKGSLTILIEQLLQRPQYILDTVETKIPSMIEANIDLLTQFEENTIRQKRNAVTFERILEEIEALKLTLMNYGEGYVFVNDFKLSEVRVIEEQTQSNQSLSQTFHVRITDFAQSTSGRQTAKKPGLVPNGLWSCMSMGMLQRNGEESPISIKVYLPSSGIKDTFQEVAKLRCLMHVDMPIAEFMGIHHTEAKTPAYIFPDHLQSLRKYAKNKVLFGEDNISTVLEEIIHGVTYIHQKGLVHMELSMDTVTVNVSGQVKLTGACVPREARLPIDQEVHASNFVYLPPEVLKGEIYVSSADVYGWGLLVYELLTDHMAFEEQRSIAFQEFVDTANAYEMFIQSETTARLKDKTVDIIKICVETECQQRPSFQDILTALKAMEGKFKTTPSRVISRNIRISR